MVHGDVVARLHNVANHFDWRLRETTFFGPSDPGHAILASVPFHIGLRSNPVSVCIDLRLPVFAFGHFDPIFVGVSALTNHRFHVFTSFQSGAELHFRFLAIGLE